MERALGIERFHRRVHADAVEESDCLGGIKRRERMGLQDFVGTSVHADADADAFGESDCLGGTTGQAERAHKSSKFCFAAGSSRCEWQKINQYTDSGPASFSLHVS